MDKLNQLVTELETLENKEGLCEALEAFISEFKERDMRGYVYVVYTGNNIYKIGKTTVLEQRLKKLRETRIVRLIKANNISQLETQLHNRFSSKRQIMEQELFRLNDEDILYIQTLPDEWEDPHMSIF